MDPCVYHIKNTSLIVAIYVDDFLIFWRDKEVLNRLKLELGTHFKMKNLG